MTIQLWFVPYFYCNFPHTGIAQQSADLPLFRDSNIHLRVGSEVLELFLYIFLQMALQFYMFRTYPLGQNALKGATIITSH